MLSLKNQASCNNLHRLENHKNFILSVIVNFFYIYLCLLEFCAFIWTMLRYCKKIIQLSFDCRNSTKITLILQSETYVNRTGQEAGKAAAPPPSPPRRKTLQKSVI